MGRFFHGSSDEKCCNSKWFDSSVDRTNLSNMPKNLTFQMVFFFVKNDIDPCLSLSIT